MKHLKSPYYSAIQGRPQGRSHQRGSTLVEWMVSITIGLILLAGLTTLIAQQSSTQAELEKSSRQIENGRYAIQLLGEDIQMAGYYGEFADVAGLAVPSALPDPCLVTVAAIEPAMAFPVQGYDSPATTDGLLSCIDEKNHVSGTDILVVRSVEPVTLTIAVAASAAASGQVYLQAGLTPSGLAFDKAMGTGASVSGFTLLTQAKPATAAASGIPATPAVPAAPAPLRKFQVHIYFVSPCSVMLNSSTCMDSDDGGKPIPTLKRVQLSASGAMSTTPLVEGIENMQIDYGFDTTLDGAPDNYAKSAIPAADWATDSTTKAHWGNVMALRVHLLARNNESSSGYEDSKSYTLGLSGTTAVSNDSFKRRVFSQLIRVVNQSSRRDQ